MILLRCNIIRGLAAAALVAIATPAQAEPVDLAPPLDGAVLDAALPPDPDAPTVGVSIDRSEAAIGDRLNLTISATSLEGVVVTLPNAIELGKFEVLSRDEGDKTGIDVGNGRRARRFVLGIASYEIGTHAIPEIRLSYINPKGEVRSVDTEPLIVTITGLIGGNEKPETQAMRAPHSTMVEDRRAVEAMRYGGIALAALLVLLLLRAIVRRVLRRRRAAAEVGPPPRPADEVAMERLQALRARGNFSLDSYRPYYFELAEILRAYLGARFEFYSLELTSAELLDVLAARAPELGAKDGGLARFFEEADLVKFAKFGSDDAAAERAFGFVQATVLSTAKRLEVESSTEQKAAAAKSDGKPATGAGGSDAT